MALLVLIQIAFYVYLCVRITPLTKYLLGGSVGLSVGFIVYLVNSSGKNEFKLTWLLPVLVFPVFGIALYVLIKTNVGGINLRKRIRKSKSIFFDYTENLTESEKAVKDYPDVKGIADYIKSIEGYPAYSQNKTQYFESGESAYKVMLEELKKAQKFIFMDYFIVDSGRMWNEILEVLITKAARGVDVRIIYDGFGSKNLATKHYLSFLKKNGINARVFEKLKPLIDTGQDYRDHHKIMVVDGKIAFTGGINLTDEYVNYENKRFDYWKDTAISVKGSGVRSFTLMFLEMWHSQDKTIQVQKDDIENFVQLDYEKFNEKGVVIPYADDAFNDKDLAENVYNYIINRSQKYLHIMTPYLILDTTMMDMLFFAAQRGVDVSIIVPGHWDHFITYCVGHRYVKECIENGIHIYAYKPGFIHAKVFVSDDSKATVGSVNLDYRSLYHHFECGTYIYQAAETIADIEKDFQNTKSQCVEITMEKYKTLSKFRRFVGVFFKIFSPLL